MLKPFRLLKQVWLFVSSFPQPVKERFPMRFWHTYKKGHTVMVSTSADGDWLQLVFQRPIEQIDIHNGKLVPTTKSRVIRRGGKRQTALILSPDTAENLLKVLGTALKDAKEKQEQKEQERKKLLFVRAFTLEL